jgi:hypothetical protein
MKNLRPKETWTFLVLFIFLTSLNFLNPSNAQGGEAPDSLDGAVDSQKPPYLIGPDRVGRHPIHWTVLLIHRSRPIS